MSGGFLINGDVEISADCPAVSIQGARGKLLLGPCTALMETATDMREDGRRHLRQFGKVSQPLKVLSQVFT